MGILRHFSTTSQTELIGKMTENANNKIPEYAREYNAKKGVEKAVTAAATKTGEHVGKKAGDKIVQMLSRGTPSREPPAKKVNFNKNVETINQQEIDQMLNNLLSGGSTRKRKII